MQANSSSLNYLVKPIMIALVQACTYCVRIRFFMEHKQHRATFRSSIPLLITLLSPNIALSFDEDQWGYGVYLKSGNYTIDDSEASVGDEIAHTFGAKMMFKPEARGRRYFASVDSVDFTLEASNSGYVNSEVYSLQLAGGYERRFSFTRDIKMWLGAALSINSTTVEDRYVLTNDGFLERRLSDHEEQGIGIQLNADSYFDVSSKGAYQAGLGLYADLQGRDAVEAFGVRLTLQKK